MQVLSRYTALSSGDTCTHNFFFSKCLHSSRVLASGEFQTWPLIPPGTTFPQFSAHAPESRSLTSSQSQDPLYFLAQNECYFFQKKTTLTYYSKSVLLLSNPPEVIIPLVHGLDSHIFNFYQYYFHSSCFSTASSPLHICEINSKARILPHTQVLHEWEFWRRVESLCLPCLALSFPSAGWAAWNSFPQP